MKCGALGRFGALLVVGAAFWAAGCESEPLKPMDEPLGRPDAHRAEERMRQNVEEMMEESKGLEAPPEGPAEAKP